MTSEKRCCVPKCPITRDDKVTLHCFPNPNVEPEKFRTWLYTIGGDLLALENDYIYKRRRVCHNHFESKYCTWTKTLSGNAVPTLMLSDSESMACAVLGCKSHTSQKEIKNLLVTFHRFPKDEEVKQKWIRCLSRGNWMPKEHTHICSKHFTADSFVPNKNMKYRQLKPNALPTLHLLDEINSKAPALDPVANMKISDVQPNDAVVPEAPYHYSKKILSNFQENDISTCNHKTRTTVETNSDFHMMSKLQKTKSELTNCKKRIEKLEKELEKVKKTNKQCLRKINTLTKRNSRNSTKNNNTQLHNILKEKLKQETVEFEHVVLLERINEKEVLLYLLLK